MAHRWQQSDGKCPASRPQSVRTTALENGIDSSTAAGDPGAGTNDADTNDAAVAAEPSVHGATERSSSTSVVSNASSANSTSATTQVHCGRKWKAPADGLLINKTKRRKKKKPPPNANNGGVGGRDAVGAAYGAAFPTGVMMGNHMMTPSMSPPTLVNGISTSNAYPMQMRSIPMPNGIFLPTQQQQQIVHNPNVQPHQQPTVTPASPTVPLQPPQAIHNGGGGGGGFTFQPGFVPAEAAAAGFSAGHIQYQMMMAAQGVPPGCIPGQHQTQAQAVAVDPFSFVPAQSHQQQQHQQPMMGPGGQQLPVMATGAPGQQQQQPMMVASGIPAQQLPGQHQPMMMATGMPGQQQQSMMMAPGIPCQQQPMMVAYGMPELQQQPMMMAPGVPSVGFVPSHHALQQHQPQHPMTGIHPGFIPIQQPGMGNNNNNPMMFPTSMHSMPPPAWLHHGHSLIQTNMPQQQQQPHAFYPGMNQMAPGKIPVPGMTPGMMHPQGMPPSEMAHAQGMPSGMTTGMAMAPGMASVDSSLGGAITPIQMQQLQQQNQQQQQQLNQQQHLHNPANNNAYAAPPTPAMGQQQQQPQMLRQSTLPILPTNMPQQSLHNCANGAFAVPPAPSAPSSVNMTPILSTLPPKHPSPMEQPHQQPQQLQQQLPRNNSNNMNIPMLVHQPAKLPAPKRTAAGILMQKHQYNTNPSCSSNTSSSSGSGINTVVGDGLKKYEWQQVGTGYLVRYEDAGIKSGWIKMTSLPPP